MKYISYVANVVTVIALAFILFSSFSSSAEYASANDYNKAVNEPLLGEVRIFMTYAEPKGWRVCKGQEIEISRNKNLFDMYADSFGGTATWNANGSYNWSGTFKLPDLESKRIHNNTGNEYDYYNIVGSYMICTQGTSLTIWDVPWGDAPQYYTDGVLREW